MCEIKEVNEFEVKQLLERKQAIVNTLRTHFYNDVTWFSWGFDIYMEWLQTDRKMPFHQYLKMAFDDLIFGYIKDSIDGLLSTLLYMVYMTLPFIDDEVWEDIAQFIIEEVEPI